MPVYHRLASKTQTLDTMVKQLATGDFWGTAHNQGGAFPAVKAYYGPLPANVDGIEFETSAPCAIHPPLQGAVVFWYQRPNGVAAPLTHGWCAIQGTVKRIRYLSVGNLQSGAMWP